MDYKQRYVIMQKNKKRIIDAFYDVPTSSGIYVLTRQENGLHYAYIGQAKNILERLASHLMGYQHIDLSLKKHGLKTRTNPNGWDFDYFEYPVEELDQEEQRYILDYANDGFQLYNHTTGSQGVGKKAMDNQTEPKGYLQGVRNGKKQLAKELKHIIDLHLVVELKPDKTNNKVSIKQLEKFNNILKELTEEP